MLTTFGTQSCSLKHTLNGTSGSSRTTVFFFRTLPSFFIHTAETAVRREKKRREWGVNLWFATEDFREAFWLRSTWQDLGGAQKPIDR